MLRKILAAATASVLALGMAIGGASPALANNGQGGGGQTASSGLDNPCDQYGYNKIEQESGTFSGDWGSMEWDGTGLDLVTEPGWTIDLCLKGGNEDNVFVDNATTGSYNVTQGSISHIGWANPTPTTVTPGATPTNGDCETPTGSILFAAVTGIDFYTMNGVNYEPGTSATGLAGGTYSITATTTGSGYVLASGSSPFTVDVTVPDSDDCEVDVSVAPSFTVVNEDCVNFQLVNGSIVLDTMDGAVSYVVTDSEGNEVTDLTDLAPGTYTVTPTAADGYVLDLSSYDDQAVIVAFDGECAEDVVIPINLTYISDCFEDTTNTWRVRNPSDQTVTVSWRNASNTLSGTHEAAPGDTFFETPRGPETMIIEWGGGDTGIVEGSKVKAAGVDDVCEVDESVAPAFTVNDQDCLDFQLVNGSIVVDTMDGAVSYVVTDFEGNEVTDLSDLAPGTYTVTPTAADGFVLDLSSYSDQAVVGGFDGVCAEDEEPIELEPTVDVVEPTCETTGSYTLPEILGVVWTIDGEVVPVGTVPVLTSQGVNVVATLDPAVPGAVFAEGAQTEFPLVFEVPDDELCELPTFAAWDASATATDEVCTPTGISSGSISVVFPADEAEGQPDPVRYFIDRGLATERELTSATTAVEPGTYLVTAEARYEFDTILAPSSFELEVGAASTDCVDDPDLPTLALTGASNALGGIGIAAMVLMMAGTGLVLVRRQAARS